MFEDSDHGRETIKTVYVKKKNGTESNLSIPNIHLVEFDFLAYKKTSGSSELHEILK